jgi:hypothetical protein
MLLVTRIDADRFDARFICPAMFIPCVGARDDETAQKLAAAFKRGDLQRVKSLRLNSQPDIWRGTICRIKGNDNSKWVIVYGHESDYNIIQMDLTARLALNVGINQECDFPLTAYRGSALCGFLEKLPTRSTACLLA